LVEQDDRRTGETRVDLGDRSLRNIVKAGNAGKPARELVEASRGAHAPDRELGLLADAPAKRRGDDRDQEEDEEGKELMRLRDRERVKRLDEKEVVGKK